MNMRVLLKPLLWLLVSLSASLIILLALLFLVDVNLYRTQIEQQVSAAFGRKVSFSGPLTFKPSLNPQFSVNNLSISNPEWASRAALATVETFNIQVSLLSLLQSQPRIIAMELDGVDLLLENRVDGVNNYTFAQSDGTGALPAIAHLSLKGVNLAYRTPDAPIRRFHIIQASARKVPGEPVELQLTSAFNNRSVSFNLNLEPVHDERSEQGWDTNLLITSEDLKASIKGNLKDLQDWHQSDYLLHLKGKNLQHLGHLLASEFTDLGPYEVSTRLQMSDKYVKLKELSARVGVSDFNGQLIWDFSQPKNALSIKLDSKVVDVSQFISSDSAITDNNDAKHIDFDAMYDVSQFTALDVNLDMHVQTVTGLEHRVKDLQLQGRSDQQQLRLSLKKLEIEDIVFKGDMSLPWDSSTRQSDAEAVNLKTLLSHTQLSLQAQLPEPGLHYEASLMGELLAFNLSSFEAYVNPDSPITVNARALLNDAPLNLSLQGGTLLQHAQNPQGPWQDMAVKAQAKDLRLDILGGVAQPFELKGFDLQFSLEGDEAETVLPLQGAYSIRGHYIDQLVSGQPGRSLIDDLNIQIATSDVNGKITIDWLPGRPKVYAQLNSRQIVLDDLMISDSAPQSTGVDWEQSLAIAELNSVDLNFGVNIGRFEAFGYSMNNIAMNGQSDIQELLLTPVKLQLEGNAIVAHLRLPWGERLLTPVGNKITLQQIVRETELDLHTRIVKPSGSYQGELMGQNIKLQLSELEASSRPGAALLINVSALLNDESLSGRLKMSSLLDILKNPQGPWRDLSMQLRKKDIQFQASGRINKPLEAQDMELSFAVSGNEIESLLPLQGLILPLRGSFAISGRFTDQANKMSVNNLKINLGKSDINGQFSLVRGEKRPKLIAKLLSENIYLNELMPAREIESSTSDDNQVIPDYSLPVDALQAFDVDLSFYGKHLQTASDELGDISFRSQLNDGVLQVEPFKVKGFGGSNITSEVLIDTTQEPPFAHLKWVANQVDMGVLLKDAGIAETIEGKIDMSLTLSGKGRTRRELLGDAQGHLFATGQNGRFGSRQLDLWGSALIRTMLSRNWRSENITNINCLIASVNIDNGVAMSDDLLLDTTRITIGAAGTLNLDSEALNLVIAPRPKRASLLSLTNPVRVSGTLSKPKVSITTLPGNRMTTAGTGVLAGLINPGYLIFTFSQTGGGETNSCAAALQRAIDMKEARAEKTNSREAVQPSGLSLFPGCTRR